ncbi:hypothetical protein HOE37_03935 [Candidatus Woesearchaeota archaeon]|jgi:hypothetical protein|nr:hypothetical protein [Candidatus Woesearchaeota archaeon]MBT4110982.1 hypothetical protein [Candidatus Woesearchaeota archaeon]MBT4336851.1 hypothetical protein [Candidatus Woesearchaeota archaeon]MBT4469834.1 hypothetical protein [Candidatus Woesearchaeota archaeon]MBT6743695.1 hypothetical protein [Candidatus Woesearchaeota archaeon]
MTERITELEERLEGFQDHEPPEGMERFGTRIGVVNDGSEQFLRDAEYGFMLMTIKSYMRTLQETGMSMGEVIEQYLDRFGQNKHLVRVFQTAYEANAPGMICSGALTVGEAIQYYDQIKDLLTGE